MPADTPHRDSWGGWISNKVATAEAALTTAFVRETPTRSHSLHNLRAVAKASRLAAMRNDPPHSRPTDNSNDRLDQPPACNHQDDKDHEDHEDHEDEVLPPLTRRASAIDLTLSHAWHAVRTAAVAAMATFDHPLEHPIQADHTGFHSARDGDSRVNAASQPPSTRKPTCLHMPTAPGKILSDVCTTTRPSPADECETVSDAEEPTCDKLPITPEKVHSDVCTEISNVTLSASCSSADFSEHKVDLSTFPASLDTPCSPVCENPRISTSSCNQHTNRDHVVLKEASNCASSVAEDEEMDQGEHKASQPDDISPEQLKELLEDFNAMFEQNGGAECVTRVKEIGDISLEAMKEPDRLNEAVEKELNDAKLKLDKTLQRLESAVRTKVCEVYSEKCDASAAAEAVIEETKKNSGSEDSAKRNASLLRDCSRLVAVFASKMCASVLDRVEGDRDEKTWNERVDLIGSLSSRGIPELRVISKRFGESIERGVMSDVERWCVKNVVRRMNRVADAGVEQVVQCVALAVAALQIEVSHSAHQCCG